MRGRPSSLARTLTVELVLVASLVSLLLLIFFFTKYMLDTPALRRGTLAADAVACASDERRTQEERRETNEPRQDRLPDSLRATWCWRDGHPVREGIVTCAP